jgi:hypothetical protein
MKRDKHFYIHILILLAAFLVALGFRFIRLGALSLSNREADIALQALSVAQGRQAEYGPYAAIVGLTGADFFVFEAGNFMARFWPALLGALVVFVPFIFRKQIGSWPASALSVLLAFSPEMVGLSRMLATPVPAMVCLLLAAGFLIHKKPLLTGITLSLGIMSGPGFWMGTVILILAYFISRWAFKILLFECDDTTHLHEKRFWQRLALGWVATTAMVGTGFFLEPALLSGVWAGLAVFVQGFGAVDTALPLVHLPLILVAYAAPAVLFGAWGTIRALLARDRMGIFLTFWWVIGFVFLLFYPAREPAHMIWVTLPLWILSARVVVDAWRLPESGRLVMAVTAVLVVAVSAFMALSLRTLVSPTLEQGRQLNFFLALFGGVVLLVAIILLVSYGWSEDIALPGLLLGLVIVFSAGLFSVSVNSTGLAPERSYELWYPDEGEISADLLMLSIARIQDWNGTGESDIDLFVSGFDTPAIHWALRNQQVSFVPGLPPEAQPAMLITPADEIPEISNSYRGQDLVWSRTVLWRELPPFQYLRWLIIRDPMVIQEARLIFWVRTDTLPDHQYP